MATGGTLRNLERRIAKVEGFEVALRYPAGRDIRGDKRGLPPYPYSSAAPARFTVAHWCSTRFHRAYPGYAVDVLGADGRPVHGRTLLSTVRATYR